jgi:hypothetical protein
LILAASAIPAEGPGGTGREGAFGKGYRRNESRTGRFFAILPGVGYTAKDFTAVADRYDLVVLDPTNYPAVPKRLKDRRPDLKVLGYLDVFCLRDVSEEEPPPERDARRGAGAAFKRRAAIWREAQMERYLYHDERGDRIRVFMHEPDKGTLYAFDRGKREVREYLARRAKEIAEAGYDGVYLDGLEVRYPFDYGIGRWVSARPPGLDAARWRKDTQALLGEIAKAVGPGRTAVAGPISGRHAEASREYAAAGGGGFADNWLNGGQTEGKRLVAEIGLAAGLVADGKMVLLETDVQDRKAVESLYAAYLMTVGKGSICYFSAGAWQVYFDADLGSPFSDRKDEGDGIWSRRFSRGQVLVNAGRGERTIGLGRRCISTDDRLVDEVTLMPGQGVILHYGD